MAGRRPGISYEGLWRILLVTTFVIGSGWSLVFIVVAPGILGSHGVFYTDAARAWLSGADPWSVGPPLVVFSGPPPMLLPFAPLTLLPTEVVRWVSVVGTAALGLWSIRRVGLPLYWMLFPPLFSSILLGHPEVLVLALLLTRGPVSGLAAVIKPYAGFALLAERRWRAIAVGIAVVVLTVPLLPWARFFEELPQISANLARQAPSSDSTFGNPILMIVAVAALARLGIRRSLWLATPLLWPYAQPGYRLLSVPALSPIIAACWALPIPGLTLIGIVLEAVAIEIGRHRTLPQLIRLGIDTTVVDAARPAPIGAPGPAGAA